MKLILISFLFLSNPTDPAEKIILDKLNTQTECWNQGDLECFMEGYWKSDSLMFVGTNVTYGWQKTLDNYKLRYPDKESRGVLKFEILSTTRMTADVYFVIGKYHLTRTIGDASGTFTLVWRKINNDWFIVTDHTS